ncbi:cellulose synthase [Nocardiopsis sp. MG754419]|nr:cellulose synthase [Nocardiopsis sp. MG754419]
MTSGLTLGAALAALGLIITFFVWRRKGAAFGLRGLAWSMLPLVAGLLGLMNVVMQFVLGLFGVLAGLVFNPIVWAGVALVPLMVILYVASGFMKARGVGVKQAGAKAERPQGDASGAAPKGKPAAGPAQPAAGQVKAPEQKKSGGGEDFDEIEALLRKHGIE